MRPRAPRQVVDDADRAYNERHAKLYEEWHEQVFEKIQVGGWLDACSCVGGGVWMRMGACT
jgi:hypothetical protein